jgi:prepilin peptidase CpaA
MALRIMSLILLLICCYTDLKNRTIYNFVLLVFLCIGSIVAIYKVCNSQAIVLLDMLLGLTFPLAVLFLPFLEKVISAGDIKLICVLGYLNGLKLVVFTFLYSALIGGVISAVVVVLIIKNTDCKIEHKIPFAPAITIGYLIAMSCTICI